MNESMNQDDAFRIAYCILCHKYTPVLAELVHQLDTPGNELFIHVDGKTSLKAFAPLPKGKRIHLIRPRVKIYWGDFGMVEASLRLFAATRDKGFRYVVLISGDTLPLRPANEIREILRSAYAEKQEFVAIDSALTEEAADRIRRRRFYPDKSTFLRRMKRFAMKRCMRTQNPYFDKLPPLKKGSQWIAITDRMRDCAFDYLASHPHFCRAFRYGHAADELFFQTLICDTPFASRNTGCSLVYTDWSQPGGAHPALFSTTDLPRLSALNREWKAMRYPPLFARKFDDATDISRYRSIILGQTTNDNNEKQ